MTRSLQIGELARAAGTPAPTIRYYEKIGLLASPARSEGNYRRYGSEDLARLTFIRRAREIGFPIDQVRNLIELSDQRDMDCCEVMAMTRQHLASIEQKIADLTSLKLRLAGLLSSCEGGKVADCRIIDALSPMIAGATNSPSLTVAR